VSVNKIDIDHFKVGEFLTVASGEYSDYCVNGLFKVEKDFYMTEIFEAYGAETGQKITGNEILRKDSKRLEISLIGYLNKNGFISDVEYREVHTGSYGEVCADITAWERPEF